MTENSVLAAFGKISRENGLSQNHAILLPYPRGKQAHKLAGCHIAVLQIDCKMQLNAA